MWKYREQQNHLPMESMQVTIIHLLGCLNGGAQIRPESGTSAKELVAELEKMYSCLPSSKPQDDPRVTSCYSEWLGGEDSQKAQQMLHSKYKAVEKNVNALGIKW